MDQSPNLLLPYIMAAQAQKHVTHNEAVRALDAIVQLAVLDRHLATPPATPANGDRYIVGASPTGAWSGHAGKIAAYQDGAWAIYPPKEGWIAWVADEDLALAWSGTAWASLAGGGGGGGGGSASFTDVGINATSDQTNRLALASTASLFNHAGAGHQIKVNKNASTDTASLLFQNGFSGRAEMGLPGTDDFSLKVSADGSSFLTALTAAAATGIVSFPQGIAGGGRLKSFQVFETVGSSTWTKPAGIRNVLAYAVGGGGGGGGATGAASNTAVGGGGGAGSVAVALLDVTGTSSETVTVGNGGAGGAAGSGGSTGGASSFGAFLSAGGGTGGTGHTAGTAAAFVLGGAGGTATGGNINLTGAPGLHATRTSGTVAISGNGAASHFGGGGQGRTASAVGLNGTAHGSGASGAATNSATARAGGTGAGGLVWVWEFE